MNKHRKLRQLNRDTNPVLTEINQAQITLERARRMLERSYQQERSNIINARDPDFDGADFELDTGLRA